MQRQTGDGLVPVLIIRWRVNVGLHWRRGAHLRKREAVTRPHAYAFAEAGDIARASLRGCSVAVAEEAEVADALESRRQDVQQKATNGIRRP